MCQINFSNSPYTYKDPNHGGDYGLTANTQISVSESAGKLLGTNAFDYILAGEPTPQPNPLLAPNKIGVDLGHTNVNVIV